jgi:hypothetical protein
MRFFTTERLGERQSLTPEGFLLCEDVPICRTGEMIYGPSQTTLPAGPEGIVRIRRTSREVFRPETVASFEGKPFVIDHPDQPDPDRWTVDPDNWALVAKGHVIGPHRGSGADDDVVLADILVSDGEAIREIRAGRREVSCGYIADYVCDGCGTVSDRKTWNQCTCTEPQGYGQQVGILGNHVALVDNGRCGSRCAIGDAAFSTVKEKTMKWLDELKGDLKSVLPKIPKGKSIVVTADGCVRDQDEEEKKKSEDQDEEEEAKSKSEDQDEDNDKDKKKAGDRSWKDAMEERADKTEDQIENLKKDVKDIKRSVDKLFKFKAKSHDDDDDKDNDKDKDTEDVSDQDVEEESKAGSKDARYAHDSAYLADSFEETVALGEILVPGFRFPTFDRSDSPKRTTASICRTRRVVLDLAYSQADMRGPIDELMRGRELAGSFTQDKSITCDEVRYLFRAAGMIRKTRNNDSARIIPPAYQTGGGTGVRGPVKTPAEFNVKMAEFWKDK